MVAGGDDLPGREREAVERPVVIPVPGADMEPSTLAALRHGADRLVLVDGHPEAHLPDRPAPAIGVLLAHAEPLVRAGLRALLEQQRDIVVKDEAPTGEDAVALASRGRPDVVLIDLRLPGLDGMGAV